MGSIDIENIITEKEKELAQMFADHEVVTTHILQLRRQKTDITGKIQDLQISENRAKNNIKQREIEIKLLTKQFWAAKNSGG